MEDIDTNGFYAREADDLARQAEHEAEVEDARKWEEAKEAHKELSLRFVKYCQDHVFDDCGCLYGAVETAFDSSGNDKLDCLFDKYNNFDDDSVFKLSCICLMDDNEFADEFSDEF